MGPPRDRLAALQSKAYFDENDDYALPLEEENEEMAKFFQDIEELRDIVQAIENDIKRVRDIQHQMLSQPQVSNAIKNDLEETMAGIKKKANQVRQRLKAMEIENEEQEKTNRSSAEMRIRKTQHMTMSRRFVDIMQDYNNVQQSFRDQSKKQIIRQAEVAGSTIDEATAEDMMESGRGAQLLGHCVIEGDEDQLRQTINDLENRHEMFVSLEKSIQELHEMFLDIAMLIENQGEMVNRIDVHVESAVEYTTRATNDTKKALEYQSKARRKKIMMLLCMIIAGGLGTYMAGKYLKLF